MCECSNVFFWNPFEYLLSIHREFNMEPKNGGLENAYPFQLGEFEDPCEFSV